MINLRRMFYSGGVRMIALLAILGVALAVWTGCAREAKNAEGLPGLPATVGVDGPARLAISAAEQAARQTPSDLSRRLELARLYLANGFMEQARVCAEPVAGDEKLGAQASYYLAHIADQSGASEESVRWLKQVLRLAPSYVPAHVALADYMFKSGRSEEARATYTVALKLDPRRPEALLGLARERLQAGEVARATQLLEELLGYFPDSFSGLIQLAQLRERLGDLPAAAALRQKSRRFKDRPPEDPWMDEVMTVCFDLTKLSLRFEDFVKSGQPDKALAVLRQMEAIDPHNWIVVQIRAMVALQQGRRDVAVREYELALAAGGSVRDIYPVLIGALTALNRLTEAETQAERAIAAGGANANLLVAIGDLRLRERRPEEAFESLTEAVRLEPQHVGARRALGLLLWEKGERDDAIVHLRAAQSLGATDTIVLGVLGQFYLDRNELKEAAPLLRAALDGDVGNTALIDMYALSQLRLGNKAAAEKRFAEAIACYDLATTAKMEFAEAYANKVQVCMQIGDYDRAEVAMNHLAQIRPNNAAIHYSLGDIRHRAGKLQLARLSWIRALELAGPQDNELRTTLEERLQSLAITQP